MGQETSLLGHSLPHPSTQPVNAIVYKVHLSFLGRLSIAPALSQPRQLLPRGLPQAARPESFTAGYFHVSEKLGCTPSSHCASAPSKKSSFYITKDPR